jgi:tripartite ATP-independent transporter DctP family solute receptor
MVLVGLRSSQSDGGRGRSRRVHARVGLLAIACAVLIGACGGGETESSGTGAGGALNCDSPKDIKFAHIEATGQPYDVGGQAFAKYLDEKAPGCFEVKTFPSSQLGQEQDIEQAMQANAVQLGVGAFALASFVPAAPLFMTPFVFQDRDHMTRVADGEIGDEYAKLVEKAGFKVIGYFTAGDRSILSTRPISSPADLRGLKMRVAPSELQVKVWKSVGVNPVDLPFGDMYTAMQTDTVQAVELDPSNIVALKLSEVAKHYTVTDHLTGAYPLIVSGQFFNGLSPELQKVVEDAGHAAEEAARAADVQQGEAALEKMKQAGVEVAQFDSTMLRDEVRRVYAQFPEALPPELLQRILADGS